MPRGFPIPFFGDLSRSRILSTSGINNYNDNGDNDDNENDNNDDNDNENDDKNKVYRDILYIAGKSGPRQTV